MNDKNELKDKQLLKVVGGESEDTLPECYTEEKENKNIRGISGTCCLCPHASTCKNTANGKIKYPEQREVH